MVLVMRWLFWTFNVLIGRKMGVAAWATSFVAYITNQSIYLKLAPSKGISKGFSSSCSALVCERGGCSEKETAASGSIVKQLLRVVFRHE